MNTSKNKINNTILIVEDNELEKLMLEYVLKKEGFNVIPASNGEEALKLLTLSKVNLIISDIMMDTVDGFKLKEILNKNPKTKKIPFIFLTSAKDKESKEKAASLGATIFLLKPFDKVELGKIAKTFIG